jgi:hypothetical protein
MNDHETASLLTKEQASERMRAAGVDYSVASLRKWRPTWPNGECKGPKPLLLSPRKLRYRESDVDAFVRQTIADAEIRAQPASRSRAATR